ncbi:MAG: hypothetical protein HFE77_03185 [Clostridiales bacterium]|nr:hypothetical protein [Clostridiales bacterium]
MNIALDSSVAQNISVMMVITVVAATRYNVNFNMTVNFAGTKILATEKIMGMRRTNNGTVR